MGHYFLDILYNFSGKKIYFNRQLASKNPMSVFSVKPSVYMASLEFKMKMSNMFSINIVIPL